MEFWKKNKWKIIAPVLIVLVLAAAFVFGDRNMPKQKDPAEQPTVSAPAEAPAQPAETSEKPDDTATPADAETAAEDAPVPSDEQQTDEPAQAEIDRSEFMTPEEMGAGATGEYEEINGMMIDTGTGMDKYFTNPVPEGKPAPREPEDVELGDEEWTCTFSISCATILDNEKLCDPEKWELVPKDGWILEPMTVIFWEGDNVFNILQRTCKQQKIHIEFKNTPAFNTAYIEGINNLYELDVGDLSGWLYAVNGWFPNYGCSRYYPQDGDVIEWVYTCDLGADVGADSAMGG